MDKLFLQILNMSITSSYIILIVIAVRLMLKKAPKIFSYTLWSVVFFRLVCSFSFESIFSLIPVNTNTIPSNIMYSQAPQIHSGISVIDQAVNQSLPAAEVTASANPMQLWIAIGEAIWLLGITVLITYSLFMTIKLCFQLKQAKLIVDNIYEISTIKTPFVFGLVHPKIYLPIALNEHERKYIVKHEQTHIKRFDPIIKFFAFFTLCLHWFNPLVWVAFLLMSADMELSCDESVIKEMGSEIKKDYSTSLLSLSTGRRMIGGCPLAFGENNIKGRIMNILNYKKPAFWFVIVGLIAVIALCIGLMSNPKTEQLTVEDYAVQFVETQIQSYENAQYSECNIVDYKIIKLEKFVSFDKIYLFPIEIWCLEYRLKPEDISKVMLAGGMNEVDGWITEDSSMGKPMMVFSYPKSKQEPKYLGSIWNGISNFSTLAEQETVLREFLEGKELLPNETYNGNHILVKFPLSTGETCQLFLSQPVVQGDLGIWCVERWMDGTGNEYYDRPNTEVLPIDYYKELQEQCDAGQKPSLLEPLQVALNYINNEIGLNGQNVSLDELIVDYSAKVEDFLETPESDFIGCISDFDTNRFNSVKASFHLDQIEWLTYDDTERLKELNIKPEELPNGFYIYNPQHYPMYCKVTEATQYYIVYEGVELTHKSVTMEEFVAYIEQCSDMAPPFRIVTKDGYVQSVTEQYLP